MGTICMQLAATQVTKQETSSKRCVKGPLYIITLFVLAMASPHPIRMLLSIQLMALEL
jgi:hypothetical protein